MGILLLRAQKHRAFWSARGLIMQARFRLDRLHYGFREQIRGATLTASIFTQLVKLALKSLIISAGIIGLTQGVESLVTPLLNTSFPPILRLNDSYFEYEALVGQIGATFLSIYFATFGIILASSYTSLRDDVIALVLREKVNNIYSKFLIQLTVVSLLTSGLNYMGAQTGYLLFSVIGLGGLLAVLCLFELGKRLFFFFDTSRLIESELVPDISKALEYVASNKIDSIHIQAHFQKMVEKKLDTISYLAKKARAGGAGDAIRRIDGTYSRLLSLYSSIKMRIPRGSYWFKRTTRHPSWFLESDTVTGIALETDMYLLPKEEPDFLWFERELIAGLSSSLRHSLSKLDRETAYNTLRLGEFAAEALVKRDLTEEARKVVIDLAKCLDEAKARDPELPLPDVSSDTALYDISLHEGVTHAFATLAIEYQRAAILYARRLKGSLDAIDWRKPSFASFPASAVEELQRAKKQIDFEYAVEGGRLTPDSYVLQLVARAFVDSIGKTLTRIADDFEAETVGRIERLVAEKKESIGTPILLSSFRTVTQIGNFADRLRPEVEELYRFAVFSDYPIEKLDLETLSTRLDGLREKLLERLASPQIIGFVTGKLEHDGTLPDYFGQCYFMLAEECYEAISENNVDRFKTIYPAFFSLGQTAFRKFDAEKSKYNQEYHVALIASVAEDLLAIGGYAYLYGEFFDSYECRDIVVRGWNAILETVQDEQAYLRWLISASDYLSSTWSFRPRDLIRTRWEMKFNSTLSAAGFGDSLSDWRGRRRHPSPLIRSVAGIGLHKASQVLVGLFMVEKVEGEFVLPRSIENFLSSLRRQRDRT